MTNTISGARPDIGALLAEMRAMKMAAQNEALQSPTISAPGQPDSAQSVSRIAADKLQSESLGATPANTGFGDLLADALNNVNDLQLHSGDMTSSFVRGEQQDLVGTMVAVQKASVGFQGLMQVRNRMVAAYEEIMRMPI